MEKVCGGKKKKSDPARVFNSQFGQPNYNSHDSVSPTSLAQMEEELKNGPTPKRYRDMIREDELNSRLQEP